MSPVTFVTYVAGLNHMILIDRVLGVGAWRMGSVPNERAFATLRAAEAADAGVYVLWGVFV